MAVGLARGTPHVGLEKRVVNVYDLATKKIVFTGGVAETAKYLDCPEQYIGSYLKTKSKFRKKYALRDAKPA